MRIRLFQKKQARLAALSGKKGKNQFFGKTTQRSYVIPMPSEGARLQPRNLSSTEEKKAKGILRFLLAPLGQKAD